MHAIQLLSTSLLLSMATAAFLPAKLMKRAESNPLATAQCDLSKAKLPQAPKPLAQPSAGTVLTHIAVGRGTQNYTCADSTENSVPAANGAVATLFNVTCMAAPFPQLTSSIPAIALRFPVPQGIPAVGAFQSGVHYFPDKTTPQFNLETKEHNWGSVQCSKHSGTDAPKPAENVPWLKLTAKSATGCTISEIYRVDTAGGVAPKTCKGQPANFEVPYAAAYWFYSNPSPQSY